jgi:hypothetical protein
VPVGRRGSHIRVRLSGESRHPLQLLCAANTFADNACPGAMSVQLDRQSIRPIAFASGVRRCLGSHLARMELDCVLEEFHNRIAAYRIRAGESAR